MEGLKREVLNDLKELKRKGHKIGWKDNNGRKGRIEGIEGNKMEVIG